MTSHPGIPLTHHLRKPPFQDPSQECYHYSQLRSRHKRVSETKLGRTSGQVHIVNAGLSRGHDRVWLR